MSPSASESSTASSSAEGALSLPAKVITKKVWMSRAACLDTTFPRMYSSQACCQFIGVPSFLPIKRRRLTLPCLCKASARLPREKPMLARNGTWAVSETKLQGLKNKLQYLALSSGAADGPGNLLPSRTGTWGRRFRTITQRCRNTSYVLVGSDGNV